jgi:hypothetical protein
VRNRAKNWIIVASLLCWQLGAPLWAAPKVTAHDSAAVPCHGIDTVVAAAIDSKPSSLPPCCVNHDCQGGCMHSPAVTIPVVLISHGVREHLRVPALREMFVETQVAEFFRPPI